MEQKYLDLHTNNVGFISDVLNKTRPSLVVFYSRDDWESQVVHQVEFLEKYKEKVPNLPLFLFDMDDKKNEDLTEALGIEQSPTFVVFKNGNMHRWLEEGRKVSVNEKSILKFLGSPVLYGVEKEEAKKIVESLGGKKIKGAKKIGDAAKTSTSTGKAKKSLSKKPERARGVAVFEKPAKIKTVSNVEGTTTTAADTTNIAETASTAKATSKTVSAKTVATKIVKRKM